MEPTPRIVTTAGEPGWPLCDWDNKPGIFPCSILSKDPKGCDFTSSPDSLEIEPVTALLFWVLYPVTITSCMLLGDCSRITFEETFSTNTSLSAKPIFVKTNTAPGAAEILNCPSGPVVVPLLPPLTLTLTPASGMPFASVTFPVTTCCANAKEQHATIITVSSSNFFININLKISILHLDMHTPKCAAHKKLKYVTGLFKR